MNQYRCETCKKPHGYIDTVHGFRAFMCGDFEFDPVTELFTSVRGCASHSDFQNQRDKVLDEHEEKVLVKLCDLIDAHAKNWNDLCEMQELIKKLRQKAGEP